MWRALQTLVAAAALVGMVAGAALAQPEEAPADRPAGLSNPTVSSYAEEHERAVVELLLVRGRLADTEAGLAHARQRTEAIQAELEKNEEWQRRTSEDLGTAQGRLAERTREAYKRGRAGWLEVLVGSADLSDLFRRVELLGRVFEEEEELVESIAAKRSEAAQAASRLQEARRQQAKTVEAMEQARAGLQEARAEQEDLAKRLGERLAAAREAARRAEERMAELNRLAMQPSVSRGVSTESSPPPVTRPRSSLPASTEPPPVSSEPLPEEVAGSGRQLQVKVTAYNLPGRTATGMPVGRGIIAVDPRVIPLGTRLYVPGYGEGIAADTGGAVKGNFIDVWLPGKEAEDWGVQHLTITILG